MPQKKVTYVISDISKMIALEWVCNYIDKSKISISFVFINNDDSEIEAFAKANSLEYIRISGNSKLKLLIAIFKTFLFLKKNKSEVVHCHLFQANIVGLLASFLARVPVRIYTRHHSTYHHEYFPKSVKYDTLSNALATKIIAISKNVKDVLVLKENVKESKIELVYHGFLISEFSEVSDIRIKEFANKYKIESKDIIIGVVSRYTKWKGIQYIIPAFLKLIETYPNAKLLLANACGNDEKYIKELLSKIPSNNIIEILYERDMGALYCNLNIYVHTPIDNHCEAFGQTYVEALMSKIPSVFTLSGIANEFIEHKKNAYVVKYESETENYDGMMYLIENKTEATRIAGNGFEEVSEKFNLQHMIIALQKIYLN